MILDKLIRWVESLDNRSRWVLVLILLIINVNAIRLRVTHALPWSAAWGFLPAPVGVLLSGCIIVYAIVRMRQ